MALFGIHFDWYALGFENERGFFISRPGRWSLLVLLPRVAFYRKKRHPSQKDRP